MRQSIAILLFFFSIPALFFAQSVAINTDGSVAHASAILDVKSITKGLLAPRMTTAQRTAIAAPAAGLLVYDTDLNTYFYRNATAWQATNVAKMLADADGDTKIQVEENVNDNAIRFDISGDERMVLRENTSGIPRLELNDIKYNTFVGLEVGLSNTTGERNVGMGYLAFQLNSTGSQNTVAGWGALRLNTTGNNNTGYGYEALYSNTSGSSNTALGQGAMDINTTGGFNTAVGAAAILENSSGSFNVGVGISTLMNSNASYNVALGSSAGRDFEHGDGNTFIGSSTQANANGYTNGTALGYQANITASNQVRTGNAGVTSIGGFQSWTTLPSDARFKTNVQENVPGLAFILKLRPVTYQVDIEAIHRYAGISSEGEINPEALAQVRTGFLAQEVEKAARALGYDFDGVDKPKNEKDLYGLRYAEFTVPLVKAVQELNAENKALKAALIAIQARLDALEASK